MPSSLPLPQRRRLIVYSDSRGRAYPVTRERVSRRLQRIRLSPSALVDGVRASVVQQHVVHLHVCPPAACSHPSSSLVLHCELTPCQERLQFSMHAPMLGWASPNVLADGALLAEGALPTVGVLLSPCRGRSLSWTARSHAHAESGTLFDEL